MSGDAAAARAGVAHASLIGRVRGLLAAGRTPEAETVLANAVREQPRDPRLLALLAEFYLELGRPDDAIDALLRRIELEPTHSDTYFELANLLERGGRELDVLAVYTKLSSVRPELAIGHFNRAVYLRRVGRLDEAVGAYRRAIDAGIDEPAEAWSNLGVILGELERHAEARDAFERALAVAPAWIPALYNLGLLLEEFGERDAALARFEQVLAIDPEHHDALARIVHATTVGRRDDPLIDRVRTRLERSDLSPEARETLSFALGKAFDDCGCYEDAFAAYATANAIARNRAAPYDRDANARDNAALAARFGAPWLARAQRVSDAPLVFVCGMWRSGTTLLERMLAGHPELTAGGEIPYFAAALDGDAARAGLAEDAGAAAALGQGYLALLERRFPGARRVVNKRPDTWRYLGLLHGLFPEARFVVMQRDPLDVCVSIFRQQLGGDALRYATDLGDIAQHVRGAQALLRHWKALFPQRILEVQYERLIDRPEPVLREICAFLGLQWHASMLDVSSGRGRGRVRTASVWQVREPLHARSVGAWRNYRAHLGAAEAVLAEERADDA